MKAPVPSTIVFLGLRLPDAAVRLAELGYSLIELNFENMYYTQQEFQSVYDEYERALLSLRERGVRVPVVHAPYEDYFSTLGGTNTDKMVDEAKRLLRLFSKFEVEVVVFHPFSRRIAGPGVLDFNKMFFGKLSIQAAAEGIRIAVENTFRAKPWNSVEELRSLVDSLDDTVGLCLDVGHAFTNNYDPATLLEQYGGYTYVTHLHDNDGRWDRHWIPGAGRIDWRDLAPKLRKISAYHVAEVACRLDEGETCRSRAEISYTILSHLISGP